MEYVGRFLGGVIGVVAVVLINGGYVYKTTCPLASGGTQTSWTWGINDIVPYIRNTTAPCYSHTGTRLALSGIGIWPLGHSTEAKTDSRKNRAAAESLRVATASITTEYARERTATAAFIREAKAKGLTPVVRQRLIRLFNRSIAEFQAIKDSLDRPINAADQQLVDGRDALSTWLGYQVAINRLFVSASSYKQWMDEVNAQFGSKLNDVDSRLRYLSLAIEARYPQVNDWGFLPAK
jgi:hypothetical protein